MKRVPIFKLSTSTLFQQDHKLEVLTHMLTSTPTIISSSNNSLTNNNNNNDTTTTTTTTVTTPISISSPPTTPNKNELLNNFVSGSPLSSSSPSLLNGGVGGSFDHFCNTCLIRFTDKEIRNVHYRSGLHRYNLNLRLSHLQPVTEEDYNILIENIKSNKKEDEDNSSSSSSDGDGENNNNLTEEGSSSDSDDYVTDSSGDEEYLLNKNKVSENLDNYDDDYYYKTFQGYQFLDNSVEMNDPKLKIVQKDLKLQLSVFKCLLGPTSMYKKLSLAPEGSDQQKQSLDQLVKNFKQYVLSNDLKWVVLLCSGGKFSGATYTNGKCIDHKTFSRYTMRRKQGGSQSKKDAESGNKKSAGAGLRRYNEKRLKEEISQLMESWKDHFKQSTHIFVFAPKGSTRDILFPPGSFLSADDERIRPVPFPIISPTFSEAQRVSTWISSVDIELFDEEKLELERQKQEKKLKQRQEKYEQDQRLKEKEKRRKEFEQQKQQQQLEEEKQAISTYDTNPLFIAVKEKDLEKVKYLLEQDESFEMPVPNQEKKDILISPLFLAIDNNDVKMASYLIKQFPTDINLLNPRWKFLSPLHQAAINGNCDMIELLLNNGADPTMSGGLCPEVPYDCSLNQKTRDKFREWAGDHQQQHQWDFSKAHIVPLTKQMKQEKEEKKKQKRKQQREKEKVKKQNEKIEKESQSEQEKLKKDKLEELKLIEDLQRSKLLDESKLSDREKRALAAERRTSNNFKICDNCKNVIVGIPFERLTFKYCTTQCVLFHKKSLEK